MIFWGYHELTKSWVTMNAWPFTSKEQDITNITCQCCGVYNQVMVKTTSLSQTCKN